MFLHIAIAAVVIIITTIIHAGAMHVTLNAIKRQSWGVIHRGQHSGIYWISGVILVMFLASVMEVVVWTLTYLFLGAMDGAQETFYFSMVTYTTLGYGDMVLGEQWRILSAFEAANGIIMFGWTTAVVYAVVQRVYFHDKADFQ